MKSIQSYRKEFPLTRKGVFLNHAGVSPICGRATKAIKQFLDESDHGMCARYDVWAARIEEVRRKAAQFIGAKPDEAAFVKNTSHGLNLVAQGLDWRKGENIVSYDKEFPANHYPWKNLESRGVELRLVSDHNNHIDIDDLRKSIDSRTRLLTISSVEFASGFRNDLRAIGKMCRERGVLFCVDAIQSLGALKLDVKRDNIDFLSADAHKWLLGPEGIGIFYVRKELIEKLRVACFGWHSVEKPTTFLPYHFESIKKDASKFEEGSHNVIGISGLGGCLSLFEEIGIDRIEKRIIALTDYLVTGLEESGWKVHSPRNPHEKSGIVTFSPTTSPSKRHSRTTGQFDPVKVVSKLCAKKIYISARHGVLRASPHFYNTEQEIDILLEEVSNLISK